MAILSSHNYKIAIRRLIKEIKYSSINIVGLALGMAAALLIMLYIMFELSYDKHHNNHHYIYRIATDNTISGERTQVAINTIPIGPMLVEQLPEFDSFLRIFPVSYFFRNIIYRYEDQSFYESGVFAVDSTFFDFFTYDFIHGSPENALNNSFSIVLTQSMSERYFGNENPIGRIINVEGAGPFAVTAVIKDSPINTHFKFEGLISLSTMPRLNHLLAAGFMPGITWQMLENHHGNRIVWVYVKTREGFDPEKFTEDKWYDFYDTHIGDHGIFEDNRLIFQPLADIHLNSKLPYEITSETATVSIMSQEVIRIFFLIALFILILASINYTNITISRFNHRSKEVGVKKVLGASRRDIVRQFFTESITTTLLALLLALLIAEVSIPAINNLMNVHLSLNIFANPVLLLIFLCISVFTGIIAGSYPALYFSSFSPIKALRYRFQTGRKTLTLKKALIILQFVISVFMIIATAVVIKQMNFINTRNLGYNQDQVIIVELKDDTSRNAAESLKTKLEQSPHITGAAVSNYFPSIITMFSNLLLEGAEGNINSSAHIIQLSPEYLDFLELEMQEGRFFDRENRTDFSEAIVINEAAKRQFGWQNAIGKRLESGLNWPDGTPAAERRVIGVIKDFHYASLSRPIEPMAIFPMASQANYVSVRIAENINISEGITTIEKIWSDFRPNYPLQYILLENAINEMYNSQRVLSIFFSAFAFLCIIIAFLGLYGLTAYAVEQRTREIGIRRVLGAKFIDLLNILGKEFVLLIIIAFIIAASLAWYFMNRWLEGFAYHTQISLWLYTTGLVAACAIAIVAITIHAHKASSINPTESLKCE